MERPNDNYDIVISVKLSLDMIEQLEKIAIKYNMTKSEVIRLAVTKLIEKSQL
jgi:metal-responsive CopG/Arc/MetJ family transcriptional regulator